MEDIIRQRIIAIFQEKKTNPTRFSGEDKAMQKRLSRQLNGGASITSETILGILNTYPDISAEWLLRGKGEMLIASSQNEEKEEEALAESLFRNVLVEFMSMVNKRLKSIDNNTQSSVDKLEGITDLLAELRKTA
jgi:hypothetical protein